MPLPTSRSLALAGAALLLLAARDGGAQQRPAAERPAITDARKAEVVDSMAALLERAYADADTGRLIAAHLRRRVAEGAYRAVDSWPLFVRALTQDVQGVNDDTHLVVDLAAGAPQAGGPPPATHGVERVERLDGNVGYLRMSSFLGGEAAARAVVAGLEYLATTDAVILDLRNSRGGSGGLANLIESHFLPADTVHVLTVHDRARNQTSERYTLASVPGPRRPDVPLFILTDDVTRSAAEEVPFVLQNLGRATIVGSRTAGAGRNNMFAPLPYGLSASVSITRVMEPRTRREWELVGVRPDVAVPPARALLTAHLLALDTLAARASDAGRRRELALVREAVQAAADTARADAARWRSLVGTYEGGQYVTLDGGALVYQPRRAQPRMTLVPLGAPDARRFAAGATRYEFAGTAAAPVLRVTTPDGTTTAYPRVAAAVPPAP